MHELLTSPFKSQQGKCFTSNRYISKFLFSRTVKWTILWAINFESFIICKSCYIISIPFEFPALDGTIRSAKCCGEFILYLWLVIKNFTISGSPLAISFFKKSYATSGFANKIDLTDIFNAVISAS